MEGKLSRLLKAAMNKSISCSLPESRKVLEDIARVLQSTLQEIVKLLLELQLDALCGLGEIDIPYFPIDLGDGLASPLVYSLLLTHNVVGILTERSTDIQEYVVNSGSFF